MPDRHPQPPGLPVSDSHGEPWAGRVLSQAPFGADSGAPARALLDALADGDPALVASALLGERVLVPVVAVLDESGAAGGLASDKAAHMAVVTVSGADGCRALPVFSGLPAMSGWDPAARPVPVPGPAAARAAYDEGAVALLIDPAGPRRMVLTGSLLVALAEGREAAPADRDPEVTAAVRAVAADLGLGPDVVRLGPGQVTAAGERVDLSVQLVVPPAMGQDAAARLGVALGQALARDELLRARLGGGLDLSVVREAPRHADGR